MTTFDRREQAFENRFAHDEEMRFKATMRRNKLLGLWAAEQMGMSAGKAEAYAKEVIKADFEEVGDNDVVRKIMADFKNSGVDVSEHRLRRHMDEFLAEAKAQLIKEAE